VSPVSRGYHDQVSMNRGWPVAAVIAFCALAVRHTTQAQSPPTPARPVIELQKSRFASTEQVFFWLGVTAPDDYRIPQSLWNTCRLTITRPDGTQRVDVVGWPMDGMLDHGWRGGWGLRSEAPQVGRYVLVFEFAGQKTSPYSFTVEDTPVLNDVTGEFVFPSPLMLGPADTSVTLTLRNRSSQTIRFPHRGVMFEGVWVGLNKTTGEKWSSSFPVPEPVLLRPAGIERSTIGEDKFSWDLVGKVPTVALAPGEIYRLVLPLNAVLAGHGGSQPIPNGEYEVRFSTIVQMLVGGQDGPWAAFAPIRLNITSLAHGIRQPSNGQEHRTLLRPIDRSLWTRNH
jgi:hypothetical protein